MNSNLKPVKKVHQAISAPIDDLTTYRAMPTYTLQHLDPFLFLNHHGPQVYPPHNSGLPFGPHPHRGFETLTYILKGDIVHWDSNGHKSRITEEGVQWMTAGSGLIHSEISSEEFKTQGGEEEVIQLWLNLSARNKMVKPDYHGLKEEEITHFHMDEGKVRVNLISGEWDDHKGPVNSLENLCMTSVEMKSNGRFEMEVPEGNQVLFYVVKGQVEVNNTKVAMRNLVEFNENGGTIQVQASEDSYLILGHGKPLQEPIVAQGPFVVNSRE